LQGSFSATLFPSVFLIAYNPALPSLEKATLVDFFLKVSSELSLFWRAA